MIPYANRLKSLEEPWYEAVPSVSIERLRFPFTANGRLPLPVSRDLRDTFLYKFHVRNFFFLFVHKLAVNQLFCIEYEIKQH